MKFRAGVYQIKNLENNKLFLKTTSDLDRAFNSDLFQLKLGSHKNSVLQNDWNTMGSENFEFSILDERSFKETASALEIQNDLKELLALHRSNFLNIGVILY